ncbi:hypothetical protein [Halobaculum limi]|uniref:hypothetical protein n=1 Tax=Halobaculum limi TaxID=3031916 RepID=UPI0024070E48|nr:hypothetical protein [Halobaculum sp. YSMS11]
MLVPTDLDCSPEATDPRSPWLSVSEQLLLVFDRIGVETTRGRPVLQESLDADALDAIGSGSTTTVSFELWDHWVRITPDVIEVYQLPS